MYILFQAVNISIKHAISLVTFLPLAQCINHLVIENFSPKRFRNARNTLAQNTQLTISIAKLMKQ